MTTTFSTSTAAATTLSGQDRPAVRPLLRPALVAGAAAAVATTLVAAVAAAAGVSFESAPGEAIPLAGFAQMTIIGAAIGLLIARLVQRRPQPRTAFMRITVALTVLSLVPDVTFPFDAASRAVLVVTHLVAAVIVVPTLARRLPVQRTR
jgi:hypothetical protein